MKNLIKSKLFLQVIVSSLVATLATAGIVIASTTIGTNINTGGTLDVTGASTLTGNTAITGTLTVTGVVGFGTASSTAGGASTLKAAIINSTTGAISFGDENLTTTGTLAAATTTISGGDFTVNTNDFYVDDDNARVGIGSSTPTANLSVGTASTVSSATTTVDFAKPCFRMMTEGGTVLYYRPSLSGGNAAVSGWATSTTSCF